MTDQIFYEELRATIRDAKAVYDTLSGKYGDFCHHEEVAQDLADAGLLTPEPQIIRTRDELTALDPDTLLRGRYEGDDWHQEVRDLQYLNGTWRPWIENVLPCVVIATGEQVRAARQALEDTDATD